MKQLVSYPGVHATKGFGIYFVHEEFVSLVCVSVVWHNFVKQGNEIAI